MIVCLFVFVCVRAYLNIRVGIFHYFKMTIDLSGDRFIQAIFKTFLPG